MFRLLRCALLTATVLAGIPAVHAADRVALVIGNSANSLSTVPLKGDPSRMGIQMDRGSSTIDITSVISGGEIGGLLTYRKEVLDPSLNELGRVALVIADQINSQQAQGIDKNGDFGAAIFNNINSAALISQRSIAKDGNSAGSGNLDVTIKDTGKLTTSDYQVTFTSATDYTVKRSDGTDLGAFSTTTSPPPVIDGFTLALNGGALSAGADDAVGSFRHTENIANFR